MSRSNATPDHTTVIATRVESAGAGPAAREAGRMSERSGAMSANVQLGWIVAGAVALAVAGNVAIALAGWPGDRAMRVVPAGWGWVDRVVGFVWVALFALMGVAIWLLLRAGAPSSHAHAWAVAGLLLVCLLYPLYTLGLRAGPGLVANVAVLVLACGVAWVVSHTSVPASLLLVPTIVWIIVASVYVVKLIRVNSAG
jgi:tryptophan-rich sensory protein